jgi:hypothetical protein
MSYTETGGSKVKASSLIATILRHDRKTASYKIALIRSLNDLVLGYPSVGEAAAVVAVPLRMLAAFWVAYYWPFVASSGPIKQGRQAPGREDISFRPALAELRRQWEAVAGPSRASDGFLLVTELRNQHRSQSYPDSLVGAYATAIAAICDALQQPVRYAGPGQYSVFARPVQWRHAALEVAGAVSLPGTQSKDLCLLVSGELWNGFCELSLWIEALCIHEWCLFTEAVAGLDRGVAYRLLTDRPDNRRPLTWERNSVEILMMEGRVFECPWTGRRLNSDSFDLDHLVPVSVYPVNELWNIIPADRVFNEHTKRDRLPSTERLQAAQPRLARTYENYCASPALGPVLHEDAELRFDGNPTASELPYLLSVQVTDLLKVLADARNVPVFR